MADDAKEPEEAPEERECRICRGDAEPENPLYIPCDCRGSIRYCHEDCLVRWLDHSGKDRCELCGVEFAFAPVLDHWSAGVHGPLLRAERHLRLPRRAADGRRAPPNSIDDWYTTRDGPWDGSRLVRHGCRRRYQSFPVELRLAVYHSILEGDHFVSRGLRVRALPNGSEMSGELRRLAGARSGGGREPLLAGAPRGALELSRLDLAQRVQRTNGSEVL